MRRSLVRHRPAARLREGLADYLGLGYVSTATWGSVSRTLEYATSDFSIAQFANALGDHDKLPAVPQASAKLAKPGEQRLHRTARADGNFVSDVGPDGCIGDGFIEGSEGQYGFGVRFNALGLFNAMGSR